MWPLSLDKNVQRDVAWFSGGKLKRLKTGDIKFGLICMTLMGEIITSLDSATTFAINNKQRSIAKTLGKQS